MFRSRAIIVRNSHIALIKRQRDGHIYYVIPGGGREADETPEQTAIRESYEEIGLKVCIDRLLAKVRYHGREQFFFFAKVTGGHFGTGHGPEMTGKDPPDRGTFTPVWFPLKQVDQINLFPQAIARLVSNGYKFGWPEAMVEIILDETS